MFNLSTQDVVLSIGKAPLVNLDGIIFQEYQDFFGNGFNLPELKNRNFVKLEFQEDLPRMRLDYKHDLMKSIKVFFMNTNITHALENKFSTELKFESVDIWIDDEGYALAPHIDDAKIKLALQIYLGDNNVGTSLYINDETVKTFEYTFNSGYALLNNSKSLHGLDKPVQKAGRISLYARYS
jgi:hypothetical protein